MISRWYIMVNQLFQWTMASTAKLPAARDSNLFVVVVNPKCGCGQEEHFTVHQKCMDPLRSNDIPLKPCDRISTVPTWGFLLSLPQYQGIPRVPYREGKIQTTWPRWSQPALGALSQVPCHCIVVDADTKPCVNAAELLVGDFSMCQPSPKM